MDHVLDRLRIDFRCWTDGSKKVLVHSSAFMPVVHLAEEEGVEVLVGTFEDNLNYAKSYSGLATLFMVGADEAEMAEIKYVKNINRGIELRHYQL